MSNLTTTVATMSSLEIVEVINEERKADAEAVGTRFIALRHDNFLVKIEKHPGIDSPKFLGEYKDGTGRALKCYHLPKREAELMVMSESLKVQTRVYDRLAEKEAAAIPNSSTRSRPPKPGSLPGGKRAPKPCAPTRRRLRQSS